MITGAEVTFGFQALKSALGLAKEAKDLTDSTAIKGKVIEMQSLILEAQNSAIEARTAHSAQIERISELEKEVARLKAWEAEKARYELIDLYRGLFAYVPKIGEERGEPPHALCANCYQRGVKSILQTNGNPSVHMRSWDCPACRTSVKNQWIDMGPLIAKSREPRD